MTPKDSLAGLSRLPGRVLSGELARNPEMQEVLLQDELQQANLPVPERAGDLHAHRATLARVVGQAKAPWWARTARVVFGGQALPALVVILAGVGGLSLIEWGTDHAPSRIASAWLDGGTDQVQVEVLARQLRDAHGASYVDWDTLDLASHALVAHGEAAVGPVQEMLESPFPLKVSAMAEALLTSPSPTLLGPTFTVMNDLTNGAEWTGDFAPLEAKLGQVVAALPPADTAPLLTELMVTDHPLSGKAAALYLEHPPPQAETLLHDAFLRVDDAGGRTTAVQVLLKLDDAAAVDSLAATDLESAPLGVGRTWIESAHAAGVLQRLPAAAVATYTTRLLESQRAFRYPARYFTPALLSQPDVRAQVVTALAGTQSRAWSHIAGVLMQTQPAAAEVHTVYIDVLAEVLFPGTLAPAAAPWMAGGLTSIVESPVRTIDDRREAAQILADLGLPADPVYLSPRALVGPRRIPSQQADPPPLPTVRRPFAQPDHDPRHFYPASRKRPHRR